MATIIWWWTVDYHAFFFIVFPLMVFLSPLSPVFNFHRPPSYIVLISSHHMPIPLHPPFLDFLSRFPTRFLGIPKLLTIDTLTFQGRRHRTEVWVSGHGMRRTHPGRGCTLVDQVAARGQRARTRWQTTRLPRQDNGRRRQRRHHRPRQIRWPLDALRTLP